MFDLSAIQILIVLVVALLVFGPKRLPELGRQLGRGMRELKGHMNAVAEGVTDEPSTPPTPPTPPASASTASPAVAHDDSDDDLLDGVVVSGGTPPAPPGPTG